MRELFFQTELLDSNLSYIPHNKDYFENVYDRYYIFFIRFLHLAV